MVAVILYATIIYSLFRITCKMKNNAFALFVASYFFYSLFQFFDWVYHAQDIYAFLLTVISIKVMEMLVGKYKIKIGARKYFMMKYSVSVIIPMYNAESTIEQVIDSVLEQTAVERVKEIIIVNDGSRDCSEQKF